MFSLYHFILNDVLTEVKLSSSCSLGSFVFPCNSPQRQTWERTASPCQWFLWPGDYSCWVSRHQHRPEVMISLIFFSSLWWVFRSWFTCWWDLAEADFPLTASPFPFAWGNPQVSLCLISCSDTSQTLFFLSKSLRKGCLQEKAEQFSSNPN